MIKEIYIDNFRCLVNFRIAPGNFQLWLGDNGSGKTTVLHVLREVQRIVAGAHMDDVFPLHTLTCWSSKNIQQVTLKIDIGGEPYEYELSIEHDRTRAQRRIREERLKWKGYDVYFFDGTDAHLFRLPKGAEKPVEGTSFPADWRRSLIGSIAEREDNGPLITFRRYVEKWLIIQPIPVLIRQDSLQESSRLDRHLENFAEWYRHIKQENDRVVFTAYESLKEALPGFTSLNLKESGDARKLRATFRIDGKDLDFDFQELSDGQRQLIVLYVTAAAIHHGLFDTLFVDEPDNFVSLREIKPLVGALEDACGDNQRQVIIISHHPEIIDELGHGGELWFSRPDGAHTVTDPPQMTGLSPSEMMARGWNE